MDNDVQKPEVSGIKTSFTPAAYPTELRVSEIIDRHGHSEMDSIMDTITAGRHLGHFTP